MYQRAWQPFRYNCAFEFLGLTFSFPRLTGKQTCTCTSSRGSGVSCRVVYCICSNCVHPNYSSGNTLKLLHQQGWIQRIERGGAHML